MKVLYLEPFSGVSGDMLLGLLVDLGVPLAHLQEQVDALGLGGRVRLESRRVERGSVAGTKVDVLVDGTHEGPADGGAPFRPVDHGHVHDHPHGTHLEELLGRIAASDLEDAVKEGAAAVYRRLAEAEARVHGGAPEGVHLHEVGALDALVDITATLAGVRWLGVDAVYSTPPTDGTGTIQAAHGTLPVPAPATVYLLEGHPVRRSDVPYEMITPTGAALLTQLARIEEGGLTLRADRVGYGAGTREVSGRPNLLRGTIGLVTGGAETGRGPITVIETAVDDCSPEIWPYAIERLLAAGARDAWITPLVMKKGRPGVQLTVLCDAGAVEGLVTILFEETGTLGVRIGREDRITLERTAGILQTEFGPLRVKCSRMPGGSAWRVHPEHEACVLAARTHQVPLREIHAAVHRASGADGALEIEEP